MGDDWAKPPPWALSARHRGLVEPPAHLSTRLEAGGDAGAPEVTSQAWRAHGGLDLLRTTSGRPCRCRATPAAAVPTLGLGARQP